MAGHQEGIGRSPDDLGQGKNCRYHSKRSPPTSGLADATIISDVHDVTQAQHEQVMGKNPSYFAPGGAGKDAVAGMNTTAHQWKWWVTEARVWRGGASRQKLQPLLFAGWRDRGEFGQL